MTKLIGSEKVIQNLNREILKLKTRSKKGLTEAALYVRRESQKVVPVDTGNLKASAYTDVQETRTKLMAQIGYTASYAPFVHEMSGKLRGQKRASGKGRYWDPQGKARPQFLRSILTGHARRIFMIIKKDAQINK